jgi:hypothetical protein
LNIFYSLIITYEWEDDGKDGAELEQTHGKTLKIFYAKDQEQVEDDTHTGKNKASNNQYIK